MRPLGRDRESDGGGGDAAAAGTRGDAAATRRRHVEMGAERGAGGRRPADVRHAQWRRRPPAGDPAGVDSSGPADGPARAGVVDSSHGRLIRDSGGQNPCHVMSRLGSGHRRARVGQGSSRGGRGAERRADEERPARVRVVLPEPARLADRPGAGGGHGRGWGTRPGVGMLVGGVYWVSPRRGEGRGQDWWGMWTGLVRQSPGSGRGNFGGGRVLAVRAWWGTRHWGS